MSTLVLKIIYLNNFKKIKYLLYIEKLMKIYKKLRYFFLEKQITYFTDYETAKNSSSKI